MNEVFFSRREFIIRKVYFFSLISMGPSMIFSFYDFVSFDLIRNRRIRIFWVSEKDVFHYRESSIPKNYLELKDPKCGSLFNRAIWILIILDMIWEILYQIEKIWIMPNAWPQGMTRLIFITMEVPIMRHFSIGFHIYLRNRKLLFPKGPIKNIMGNPGANPNQNKI